MPENDIFVSSALSVCLSFTNPELVHLHLLRYWNETKAYKNGVYLLAKQLVEQLATLHLPALGAVLNVFAQEHVDCMDVIIHLSMSIQGQVDSLCRSGLAPFFGLCGSTPAQKSELRAHQMARNCGVPGSLRTKSELSSHQMAHPSQFRTKNPS